MAEQKQLEALVALHEPTGALHITRSLVSRNYRITLAKSVQEILNSIDQHGASHYALYLMDANLGSPGSDSSAAAEQVYNRVKDAVDQGNVKFMSVTANESCLQQAQAAGIPCILKPDIFSYFKNLS